MEPTKRIILNTSVQYLKALITMALSLLSMRIILEAIGISDYGIYSVVGGVIAMLGFITNSLVITTQRYISYYIGKNCFEHVKGFFVNSLFLHICFALAIATVLFLLKSWLMNDFLTIDAARLETAKKVYDLTVGILFITIVTSPFKALFIAHENIVFISIVEILDAVLKFALAISLLYINFDKLLLYAFILAFIQLLNLFAYVIYGKYKFRECTIQIRKSYLEKKYIEKLIGFAGWTTYSMGAVAARNQGTAVILNHFFGTVVNAAYGIAFQVQSAVSFVSTSLLNAINPQIMKAEGEKDRSRTIKLAQKESKYSASLLILLLIPLMVEMPSILVFWIKTVPPNCAFFCDIILISFIFDQSTIGLNAVNQAIGRIRTYSLLTYTPKLLYLPVILIMFSHDGTIKQAMYLYAAVELMVALSRIPYIHLTTGMKIKDYFTEVLYPLIPLALVTLAVSYGCTLCMDFKYRFILTFIITFSAAGCSCWYVVLSKSERNYFTSHILQNLLSKFRL